MIHIAVVEDEDVWAETIEKYLNQFMSETHESFQVRRFTDGYEIVEKYPEDLDIIFMDINMSLMDGMEAAEEIRRKDERVIIIFFTNMAQFAIRGYQVNALDYILKPLSYVAFSESLKKAIRSLDIKKEIYITIKFREGIKKISATEILWIESQGHNLTFHIQDAEYTTTVYSMKEMEKQLKSEGFKRCNNGSLVNLRQVTGIQNGCVEIGDTQIQISRGKKNDFMSVLVSYMTE